MPHSLGHVTLIRTTDKAILVRDENDTEIWVPKSVIHDDFEVYSEKTPEGELVVEEWWANKNGYL